MGCQRCSLRGTGNVNINDLLVFAVKTSSLCFIIGLYSLQLCSPSWLLDPSCTCSRPLWGRTPKAVKFLLTENSEWVEASGTFLLKVAYFGEGRRLSMRNSSTQRSKSPNGLIKTRCVESRGGESYRKQKKLLV